MSARVSASWAAKYPFTKEAKEYIRLVTPPIQEFCSEDLKHVLEFSYERAKKSVIGQTLKYWRREEDEMVAVSFPLALAIIKATQVPLIFIKFALGEAKRAYSLLKNDTPENLIHVAKDLNLDVYYAGNDFYGISFLDYLKIATKMSSYSWRLVNNFLEKGYVMVSHKRLSRIVSERVREYVLSKLEEGMEVEVEGIRVAAKKLVKELSPLISKVKPVKDRIKVSKGVFPPCIKRIYEVILKGGNPGHMARFALTTFLLASKYDVEEILNVFSKAADFDERIARYQIEHIAGQRGGRKKYMVPSCGKMRIYNLCFPTPQCKGIKNPIQYFREE